MQAGRPGNIQAWRQGDRQEGRIAGGRSQAGRKKNRHAHMQTSIQAGRQGERYAGKKDN